jgi:glycosyltransferase involved in cell wall biosynthesis
MSLGLPVVATDCPSGPSEIVRHGKTGLLVPVEDVQGLSDAVIRLLSDPTLRDALGIRAREAMVRFDPLLILDAWSEALGLHPAEDSDGRS